MNTDTNRLLMQLEQLLREINREVINPEIEMLSIDGLRPVVELVARSRAAYLKRVFEVANKHHLSSDIPSQDEMSELRGLRQTYIDLSDASKSVEVAIQRGYLDIGKE